MLLVVLSALSEVEAAALLLAFLSKVNSEALVAATSATLLAKHVLEDVVHVHALSTEATTSEAGALLLPGCLLLLVLVETILAQLVVNTALLLVSEDLVGIRDLLELLLGRIGVVRVLVRVILDGLLFECLLKLLLSRVLLNAEQVVVVGALWRLGLLTLLLLALLLVRTSLRVGEDLALLSCEDHEHC
jgi:hypothetical protein